MKDERHTATPSPQQTPPADPAWGKAGRLVAVVVTYNRCPHLQVTLARLLAQPAALLQAVVVVDNASTDGTRDWLAAQSDPRLLVHHSPDNTGGAGGFAVGMRLAMQRFDPDWLVVMDDDARPDGDALAVFHDLDLIPWDAVAAAVYLPDGQVSPMNRPARNPFWTKGAVRRILLDRGRGRVALRLSPPERHNNACPPDSCLSGDGTGQAPAQPVDVASFVGFFIRRAAIERIGYPDPGLFIYGDDGLYTLGLRQAGGRIGFQPAVRFEHDCSTFGGHSLPGRFAPLWKAYFYHRNLLMLYRAAAGWLFWPALLVLLPIWLRQLRWQRGERVIFLHLFWLALKDGLRGKTHRPLAEIEQRIAAHHSRGGVKTRR